MNNLPKSLLLRLLYALIGVAIFSFGSATLRIGQVGLDPFTAANIGIGDKVGLSLGVYQVIINIIILIFVFFFDRKYIGLGTIINMFLTGFFIDYFTLFYQKLINIPINLVTQSILLVCGILIFTFGASFYMSAKLGNAPYDAIAPLIVDYTHKQYRIIRIIQDVIFLAIALVFGGPVGIGTIINAFFTGPLIAFWNDKVNGPFIEKTAK
ncbi:hypothetical protein QQG09_01545 [Melissococcus plutonius]|uniref:Integral membrane protein n=2 Tax=Melissococcus plutonius TaxID=33970 RepID=A0A2Z5Y2G4_9ENTE|nr:membrane protein [Melissococcus plutonius]BAL62102.1 hypothetical protein MPD5_0861 [Melissococcus plutonius DAT561]MCV2497866.1 hypothetical protein [Melissococcus plutonius]MCV2500527.1 hypothetical protein [Melissococcus plutonius]MCV2505205.1 hypothetical protein [Melissococcus plutonius]MCV2506481.1 hypothetical protein [Melissococcus plutonius]